MTELKKACFFVYKRSYAVTPFKLEKGTSMTERKRPVFLSTNGVTPLKLEKGTSMTELKKACFFVHKRWLREVVVN
jgi:hypothetical protein